MIILNEKRSTGGSPYVYYKVEATPSNRTTSTVDITFKVTGWLPSNSSVLGSGSSMGINTYVKVEGIEKKIELKSTSTSWSGTTKHSVTEKFTFNVDAMSTSLKTYFRADRTGSASGDETKSGVLKSTSCIPITIEQGHVEPTITAIDVEELNPLLQTLDNSIVVNHLSNKKFTIYATAEQPATLSKFYVKADKVVEKSQQSSPCIIEYNLEQNPVDTSLPVINLEIGCFDSLKASSSINYQFEFVNYVKPFFVETSTYVQRQGQATGKVLLTYVGRTEKEVSTISIERNVYYKFWREDEQENDIWYDLPVAPTFEQFGNQIEVGSTEESAFNYIDPDYAWNFKFKVTDNFYTYESTVKKVSVGEATWSEFRDRVDFKKITIKDNKLSYEPYDTLEINNRSIFNGYVSSSTKKLYFTISTDKSIADINTIICTSLLCELRGAKGYINSTSGMIEYVNKSGYTIECNKINDTSFSLILTKNDAFTNVDNNTLVCATLETSCKFEFFKEEINE